MKYPAPKNLDDVIVAVRGRKVILDSDLARIYGLPTFRFNEAVKRNPTRFPSDFMFRLSRVEWKRLQALRSQIAILKPGRGKHRKHLPYAFTEHGAVMAANILNSPKAVQMSVFVVRAFLKMRTMFGRDRDLGRKLAALEEELRRRLNIHESAIVGVLQRIMKILDPPPPPPEPPRPQIGFHAAVKGDRKVPCPRRGRTSVGILNRSTARRSTTGANPLS